MDHLIIFAQLFLQLIVEALGNGGALFLGRVMQLGVGVAIQLDRVKIDLVVARKRLRRSEFGIAVKQQRLPFFTWFHHWINVGHEA
ncbi:hypothetical protein D3C77_504670 [compost metagenome]